MHNIGEVLIYPSQFGQEESLAKLILPCSERPLMTEAAIHSLLLDDGRSVSTDLRDFM
jgi:hypothetical protein